MPAKLTSRLRQDADARAHKTTLAVHTTVFRIQAGARARARVDTGEMRARLRGEMTGEFEGRVIGGARHTIYNELGTRYMSAQPMLVPAAEEATAPFHRMLRDAWG
jgi:HK97 gp10 family phage protein